MTEVGVIHGRFQVLHNDHLAYLLHGKSLCRQLIVGITNPDPSHMRLDSADPNRSLPETNPLTYYERHLLIKTVLAEAGVPLTDFSIVPLPINFPELFHHYVPTQAIYFLSIYDDWGRRKKDLLEGLGLSVQVISDRPAAEKGQSASDIRRRIANDEPWTDLVPPAVSRLLGKFDIQTRLRQQSSFSTKNR